MAGSTRRHIPRAACQVCRQVLGEARPRGTLFEEEDPASFVAVSKTKDGEYMLISSTSKTSSEVGRESPALDQAAHSQLNSADSEWRHGRDGKCVSFKLMLSVLPHTPYPECTASPQQQVKHCCPPPQRAEQQQRAAAGLGCVSSSHCWAAAVHSPACFRHHLLCRAS